MKFAGPEQAPSPNLYLAGLPVAMDQDTLLRMFKNAGLTVARVKMLPDTKGVGTAAAFAQVLSIDDARRAISTFHLCHLVHCLITDHFFQKPKF